MENIENSFFGNPQNKIDEYKMRIKNGKSIESFGEIPESWKKEIQDN